ncbi:hypothetical protein [Fusibacter bizertensis]
MRKKFSLFQMKGMSKKRTAIVLVNILLVLVFFGCSKAESKPLYYGQEPPGLIPEIFAPEVISTIDDTQFACTFSPDGKEIFYTMRANRTENPIIMTSKQIDGVWSKPVRFQALNNVDAIEPHLSIDGKTLYFGAQLTSDGIASNDAEFGIWTLSKIGEEWTNLTYVNDGMFVSATADGSIYMTDIVHQKGIVKVPFDGKNFLKSERVKGGPNQPINGIHPCISRDERFLIYDCDRTDGYGGEGDLYVSFKKTDGTWSEGVNLGPDVNSEGVEFAASLSPDGKYIFFMKNYHIYWVDVKIIDQFNPL